MRVVINSKKEVPKVRKVSKKAYLVITIFVLLLGVFFGCYLANNIGSTTAGDLKSYLNGFEVKENIKDILTFKNLTNNMFENVKYILVIWILGFSPYLIFGTIIINFYKGFIDSFATYFLISKFGIDGIKLAVLPLIAYKLFYIYVLIYISSRSLSFALNRDKKISLRDREFRKYIYSLLIAAVIMCAVATLETLTTPYILKAVIG